MTSLKGRTPVRKPKVRTAAVSRHEFKTLRLDLQACTEQVDRLERRLAALQDELDRLRERVRN
jgi:polyhydroxyalkanoate synthesis regulator phasin